MLKTEDLFVHHSQCHKNRYSGNAKGQGISSCCVDLFILKYSVPEVLYHLSLICLILKPKNICYQYQMTCFSWQYCPLGHTSTFCNLFLTFLVTGEGLVPWWAGGILWWWLRWWWRRVCQCGWSQDGWSAEDGMFAMQAPVPQSRCPHTTRPVIWPAQEQSGRFPKNSES